MTEMQAQAARAIGQAVVECGKDCLSHDDLVLVAKAMQQVCVCVCVYMHIGRYEEKMERGIDIYTYMYT